MDNREIISDYYHRNLAEMQNFAMRIVKNQVVAEDIVQDTFLRLLATKEIIIERSLSPFVHKMIRNQCIDYLRRTKYHQLVFQQLALASTSWNNIESEVYAKELKEAIDEGITLMPKHYQNIYQMSIYEGKKVAEITATMGISYKATENYLGRARAAMRSYLRKCMIIISMLAMAISSDAADRFVGFIGGDLHLTANGAVVISVDDGDHKGVRIAANSLAADILNVTGRQSAFSQSNANIIIGTMGKSKTIDTILKQNRLTNELKGKTEKYIITTIDNKMIIAGSDYRGTIYGIYEMSRQMGVSPWYWWADVPVVKHSDIYINKGVYTDGEPAVRYRGIFLNDEAPCLTTWVNNTFKTNYGGHEFYEKVFELILRLRGNMMWPAMWGWAFYADDPLNQKTANDMGIIMGTSHHEPMARNHQEWARHRKDYGAWNYSTNKEVIKKFFREGIERIKGTDDMVTIGMRGDGDEAMSEEADTRLLEEIVADQRKIIERVTGKKAKETPQVWALYKEVLDYYDKGMRVPDDVIMLLCDDNWGNVRRVPTDKERQHKGGWGLYYHVDYVGAPRNTKWLNVTPTQNMWEQLTLASQYGIDRLWILNVGDLKPMEYPITLFMDMAWNPAKYDAATLTMHTEQFCRELFGCCQATEAARILNLCCKYAGRSTAEMLDASVYDAAGGEWAKVVAQYDALEADALRQFVSLDETYRDTYRQIILFPVQAMANLHRMYQAKAMNDMLMKNAGGKYSEYTAAEINHWADRCAEAFRRDSLLCDEYNTKMSGGKWNGMMIQKHIGYTSWHDGFPRDIMPAVARVEANSDGGDVIPMENGVANIEAMAYFSKTDGKEARWTEIPFMGKSRSALSLQPYTAAIDGASLTYKFSTVCDNTGCGKACESGDAPEARIHIIVKSTLDFLNGNGFTYNVSVDGGEPQTVNFNSDLNEKPENIYDIYYPTIARRVVDKTVTVRLPKTSDGMHTITITPNSPAIVFEKIVVDCRKTPGRISHL
ncbi:MAG: sigma-70 family RNA polymerase sigma factor [Prevotella sp.]|nr:sigma-70 family RNA polymerase sigma factor [Prevotella sp.]